MKQTDLFAKKSSRFGGDARRTRASRLFRPVSVKQSMHLILKSKHAKGDWSFLKPRNKALIARLIKKYADQFGVRIYSSANVGNHLHFHLKFNSAHSYKSFVRTLSGAIALKVTGASKINPLAKMKPPNGANLSMADSGGGYGHFRFWTQTPYTRFVFGVRDFLKISDYLKVNQLEGFGISRGEAEYIVHGFEHLYVRFDDS